MKFQTIIAWSLIGLAVLISYFEIPLENFQVASISIIMAALVIMVVRDTLGKQL